MAKQRNRHGAARKRLLKKKLKIEKRRARFAFAASACLVDSRSHVPVTRFRCSCGLRHRRLCPGAGSRPGRGSHLDHSSSRSGSLGSSALSDACTRLRTADC